MIVRRLEDVDGTDRDVKAPTFSSRRFLLKKDGMGFSFHDTVLYAGSETYIWYKHHLEAVYCIDGTGEIEDLDNEVTHPIRPGTFYALDGHERHYLRATTDLRMMCVFSPALTGEEVHDEEGAYPPDRIDARGGDDVTSTATTETRDLYPSRVEPEPTLTDRRDPVLHGEPTGALTPFQRNAYQANGFLTFPGFFPQEEVRGFQKEAERLRGLDELRGREDVITEPESDEIRSIFRIHETSEVFDRVARDPRIVGKVRELLGDDVYIHQSRINYKPGFRGKEFYWHSDFETWHVEDGMPRMRAVSCSIALTPNYEFNGPLMLVPGSHQYFLSCVGETPEDHYKASLKKQEYGVPDPEGLEKLIDLGGGIEVPKGPAGSVTMFECNTMHGSASNITPFPRTNLFIVYNSVDNALVAPFSGQKPRPGYLGERGTPSPLQPAS